MRKWWRLCVALVFLCGCSIIKPPKPPGTCPDSCPIGSQCTDPAKGCQPIPAPGPVCTPGAGDPGEHYGCWFWPEGAVQWMWACPVYDADGNVIGVQAVIDPALCPEKPRTCGPRPPDPSCPSGHIEWSCGPETDYAWVARCVHDPSASCVPDSSDSQWVLLTKAPLPQSFYDEYKAVALAMGNTCGQVSPDESKQNATLKAFGARWREMYGRCADKWADSVAAHLDGADPVFAEMHAVNFGSGCVNPDPGAYKNLWRYGGTCEPKPIRKDESGNPRIKLNAKVQGLWVDATPVTEKQCSYCEATGQSPGPGGVPRCSCPMRVDGDACRIPLETWVGNVGYRVEGRNDQKCIQRPTNQLEFAPTNTNNCRLCAADGLFCTEWF